MEPVAHGGPQEVGSAGGQRRAEQRGALNVEDGVGAGVDAREQRARLVGRQDDFGNDDHRVRRRGRETNRGQPVIAHRRDDRAAVPRGQRVVGMSFELGDGVCQVVVGERRIGKSRADRDADRIGGGTAAEPCAQRDLVDELDGERRRAGRDPRDAGLDAAAQSVMRRRVTPGVPPRSRRAARQFAHLHRHANLDPEGDRVETGTEVRARRRCGDRERRRARGAGHARAATSAARYSATSVPRTIAFAYAAPES